MSTSRNLKKKLSLPTESQSRSPTKQQQSRSIYPWSEHRLNLLPPTFLSKNAPPSGPSPSPFPRYYHALPATATAAGDLFVFGGLVHDSLRNDLYLFSTRDLSATLLETGGEVPSPRVRHAGARMGDALLIWGGATNTGHRGVINGPHDDSLYLLNLASRVWTRVVVNGPGPEGRYWHAVTMVGSKFFVFGGQNDGKFLNDLWAFDLNSLISNPVWNSYEPAPGDVMPPPRAGHVLVNAGDRIILFGGTNGRHYYNDTWLFDVPTRKWTELQCTGYTPSPRHSHAAALVDDVLYVFGGRVDGASVDDLLAFKLSTQRWFMFENLGSRPSRRWGHAMASDGTRVFVLGGISSAIAQRDALIHVLDTKHIEYPKSDSNAFKPSEKTTQLARKSSAGHPTQKQPQHLTSSSPDAYAVYSASPLQRATPKELGRLAIPQITRERSSSPNGLLSQPMGVNGQPRHVPEEDDDGEDSAEYRVKVTVPDASSEGTVARLERERLMELEQQLSATLAAQTERDRRLTQLTDELALKSALLEQAEANAVETTKGAGLEHVDRLLAQVEQKDAELVNMQAKLDELLLSHDQHMRALEQALQNATSRAADADERSKWACEQIGQSETELAGVRVELDARKSELEAFRLRLSDAENGCLKNNSETDILRAMTTTGPVSTDEDRIARGLMERIRAMESEMASLRLSEKSLEGMQTRNEG